jgi:hypothetical protein
MISVDVGIDNAFEPELGPEDQPGQAETADRRLEELRVLVGRWPSERRSRKRVTWQPKVPAAW